MCVCERLVVLSEEVLLKVSKCRSTTHITTLNLQGNGLIRLKHLAMLPSLVHLTVSFNDLTCLDDLAGLVRFVYWSMMHLSSSILFLLYTHADRQTVDVAFTVCLFVRLRISPAPTKLNWSRRCGDMAFFDFSRWRPSAILDLLYACLDHPQSVFWWSLSLCKIWFESVQ